MPIYVIVALYGANTINWTSFKLSLLGSACVASILLVCLLPASSNHPYLYKEAAKMLMLTPHSPFNVVASRDPKLAYYPWFADSADYR